MSTNKYPEEIYKATNESGEEWAERVYDLGKKHREVPESATWILEALERGNISPAVAIGEACALGKAQATNEQEAWTLLDHKQPIDYEKLDGHEAKCVHDDVGTLLGALNYRGAAFPMQDARSWSNPQIQPSIWCLVMRQAWDGEEGWKLYVKGELPLRKRTADELPFGTLFTANFRGQKNEFVRIAGEKIQFLNGKQTTTYANDYEVIEVLGMYGQKESE